MATLVGLGLSAMHSTNALASAPDSLAAQKAKYKRPKKVLYTAENAYSKEREQLGRMLFFDPRVSSSNVMSCATCHNPSFSWGDSLGKGVGHGHKQLGRKTPTILNLAWTEKMMWDGRLSFLEAQALGPIGSPGEMNMTMDGPEGLAAKISGIKGYNPLFAKAYPGEAISPAVIGKAIAVYERGVVSGEAPFDRWIAGNEKAISAEAKAGFALFNGKAKCADCHSGWSFSDGSFQDIGINDDDIGRGKFVNIASQQHAFKTPGLRNITLRGPYMHNGSGANLEEVVAFYNRGGDVRRESVSTSIAALGLNGDEQKAIIAFLGTLTGKDKPVELPIFPR
jgi:cytochrome c peroxidase